MCHLQHALGIPSRKRLPVNLATTLLVSLACAACAQDWTDITSNLCPGQPLIPNGVTAVIDEGRDLPAGRLIQGTTYEYLVTAVGNGSSEDSNIAANTPRKTVVLVRGYGPQNADYWAAMRSFLLRDQFEVWDATSALDGRQDVRWNANQLKRFIEDQMWSPGRVSPVPRRLSILAHSMGGVITREYLASRPPIPVDCVVMLSPANCGSPLANIAQTPWGGPLARFLRLDPHWPSTTAMRVENVLLFNRTHHVLSGIAAGRRYYTVAGIDGGSLLEAVLGPLIQAWIWENDPDRSQIQPYELENDGIVTKQSSWGQVSRASAHFAFPTLPEGEVIQDDGVVGFDETTSIDLDHFQVCNSQPLYDWWIMPRLLGLDGAAAAPAAETPRERSEAGGKGQPNAVQWAAAFSGTIGNQEVTNFPVVVDTSTRAQFSLLWSTGALAFALIRPDGVLISPASTNAHPEANFQADLGVAVYNVLNPDPGVWRAEVTGSDVASSVTDYGGLVLLWNDLGLTIDRGEAYRPTNGPVTVVGRLMDGDTAILGASVSGQMLRPDGATNEVVLFDDGLHGDGPPNDGLYAAVITDTASTGVYGLSLQATGLTPGGEPFQRIGLGQTTFTTFEPTAAFTDNYDDYGIDLAPANGLIDYFVIEVGMRAMATGEFTVGGTLTRTNGTEIASAVANVVVTNIGTQTVRLQFDAGAIYDSRVTGGFDLRNLVLCGTGTNLAPLDSRSLAYRTAGYDWNQFQLTDTDGDGLSDRDEREVYHTNPELADSDADGLSDYQELFVYHTNPLSPDTDGDGMTDGWEVAHGLNPLLDDANLDPDRDGLTNLQEFLLGTDPQVPNQPCLDALGVTTNGGFALAIAELFGRSATVQASLDLINWQAVTNFTGSTNATIYFEDPGVTNAPWRFYRAVAP